MSAEFDVLCEDILNEEAIVAGFVLALASMAVYDYFKDAFFKWKDQKGMSSAQAKKKAAASVVNALKRELKAETDEKKKEKIKQQIAAWQTKALNESAFTFLESEEAFPPFVGKSKKILNQGKPRKQVMPI